MKKLLLVGVLAVYGVGAALAGGEWTTSTWSLGSWQPGENNLLAGLSPKSTDVVSTQTGYGNASKLTDGQVPSAMDDIASCCPLASSMGIKYVLAKPSDITEFRLYTLSENKDHEYIRLKDGGIQYKTRSNSNWQTLSGTDLTAFHDNENGRAYASFHSTDGLPLIREVTEIQFHFGTQENGFGSYVELEALGMPSVFTLWTTGSWNIDTWAPGANNVLAGLIATGSGFGEDHGESIGGKAKLTDGTAKGPQSSSGNGERCAVSDYTEMTFNLESPADIREFRIYSMWNDSGRDKISVSSIRVSSDGGTNWTDIPDSNLNYENNTYRNFAALSMNDGSALAENVNAIMFKFGKQENGYVGYIELEALAIVANPSGRVDLKSRGVDTVQLAGVCTDLGAGAASADFYFAYVLGEDATGLVPVKQEGVISAVDGSVEIPLSGLTANSTYSFAYYFKNDRDYASELATGTFTTASAITPTPGERLTVPAGDFATVAADAELAIPGFDVNGTFTVGDGARVTVSGSGSGDTSTVGVGADVRGEMTVGEGAQVALSSLILCVGQGGGRGYLTVADDAVFVVDGNVFMANNLNDSSTSAGSYGQLDVFGVFRAKVLQASSYWPSSTPTATPKEVALASVVNVYEGGALEIGMYKVWDCCRCCLNLAGGTLKITQGGDQFFNGQQDSKAIVVMTLAEGTTNVIDVGKNDVTLYRNVWSGNSTAPSGQATLYIEGSGTLVKRGTGKLTIVEAGNGVQNSFTGDIEVEEGDIALGKALGDGQEVFVHDGASYTTFTAADASHITYETAPTGKIRLDVDEDITGGYDLAASNFFLDDCLGGPIVAASHTLAGIVTHAEATVDHPFVLHGNNANATLTLDGTGLENSPLRLEGEGTFAFKGDRTLTAANNGDIAFAPESRAVYRQSGVLSYSGFAWDYPAGRVTADTLGIGSGASYTVDGSSVAKCRYYRFRFTKVGDGTPVGMQISEIEFFNGLAKTDFSGGVASGSSQGTEGADKAFDGNINTKCFDGNANKDDVSCWIKFDFGEGNEQLVTSYRWMTGNDNAKWPGRNPVAWVFEASNDDSTWTTLDVQYEQPVLDQNYKYTQTYDVLSPLTALKRVNVVVGEGGTLNVKHAELPVKSVSGPGAVNLVGADSKLMLLNSNAAVKDGGITGDGSLVKHGKDSAYASGVNTYKGDTVVSEGEYIVYGGEVAIKYYKLVITDAGAGTDHCSQLTRFALFDENGVDQALGLTMKGVGTDATQLAAGEFYRAADYRGYNNSATDIFRDNDTKWCWANGNGGPGNEGAGDQTYTLVLRLADAANKVVSYNFRTGGDDQAYPERGLRGWTLYGSENGTDWKVLDSRSDFPAVGKNNAWYNDGVAFPCRYFVNADSTDRTIPSASTVIVAPGARLTVKTEMTILNLQLDFDAEASAVIDGLKLAPKSALYLTSGESDSRLTEKIVKLTNLDVLNTSERQSCAVYFNGATTNYRFYPVNGSGKSYVKKCGFTVMIR